MKERVRSGGVCARLAPLGELKSQNGMSDGRAEVMVESRRHSRGEGPIPGTRYSVLLAICGQMWFTLMLVAFFAADGGLVAADDACTIPEAGRCA